MKGIAGVVTFRKNERLFALSLRPLIGKYKRVPVNFIEKMRSVNPSLRAIRHPCGRYVRTAREHHVRLVSIKSRCGVVTAREMDVRAKRRRVAITVLIRESSTSTSVLRILNPNTVSTCAVDRVKRLSGAGTRAGPLHWLRSAFGGVENGLPSGGGWSARKGIANNHAVARLEWYDFVVGGFKAVQV